MLGAWRARIQLLWLSNILIVAGWWDEGHMLTAAVAERYLDHASVLSSALRTGGADFANFSNLVTAAVWLDHMKCSKAEIAAAYCQGLKSPADFHLTDSWHFVTLPYNPSGIELSGMGAVQPTFRSNAYAVTDAVSMLAHVGTSLPTTESVWTRDFMLRLLLHVMGDLHQPLHTTSLYSRRFPQGDAGGNFIKAGGVKGASNLHAIWDGAGGLFAKSWPIAQHELDTEVERLTRAYSPESFVHAGRLSKQWRNASSFGPLKVFLEAIVNDTHTLVPGVYAEYLASETEPFVPSHGYTRFVGSTAESQFALGGYRLASWLNALSRQLPGPPVQPPSVASGPSLWEVGGAIFVGLALVAFIVGTLKRRTKRRSQAAGFLLA